MDVWTPLRWLNSYLSALSQNAETALELQHPVPLFLPVRTKKRYFIPPAVGVKSKTKADPEARARAAGIVFRQEYMERPINIACTGKMCWHACMILSWCFHFLLLNGCYEHYILFTLCSDNSDNHNISQNVTHVFVLNFWRLNKKVHTDWSVVSDCLHQRESLTLTSLQRVTLVFPLCRKKAWNSELSRYDRVPPHSWRKIVFFSCISSLYWFFSFLAYLDLTGKIYLGIDQGHWQTLHGFAACRNRTVI